jgi:Holliday junction resolvasome RuvABC endonuclease subunit
VNLIRRQKDNYLGLDLSLTGTGVVVLNAEDRVEYAATLKSKLKGMERLLFIRNIVEDTIIKWNPKLICVEGYSMGSSAGQAFSIGELGGVIKLLLHEMQHYPYLIPPTRLKKFITGGGKAEKDMIMMKVFQRWGWEAGDNNQSDSYGLAKIAQALGGAMGVLNKAQQEVIQDILHPPEKKGKKK